MLFQSCVSSGDSELDRVSSGWITSPSLSKFGGSYPQGFQTCPFSVGVCSLSRGSRVWGAENSPSSAPLLQRKLHCPGDHERGREEVGFAGRADRCHVRRYLPKICGYYLSALIITLGAFTSLWSKGPTLRCVIPVVCVTNGREENVVKHNN